MTRSRQPKIIIGFILSLVLLGAACRLTSPTPASWAGTPSAARTTLLQTQQASPTEERDSTPTESQSAVEETSTPQPTLESDGPWLVYLAPDQRGLHAYDVDSRQILDIPLPEPIITADLMGGLSPDGRTLIIRAGSPDNIDELAIYQVDLPSTEVTKVTPLLSIQLQREIINADNERALETLHAVTRPDGLAWSHNGEFLAFTAALDGSSSDLYVLDTEKDRISRLNGLYSQSATPFWAPENNWLISQELSLDDVMGWRSEVVYEISMPGAIDHNALYLPAAGSQGEVFLGWINTQSFISYSLTAESAYMLRQVNVDSFAVGIILQGHFAYAAYDPDSASLAYVLGEDDIFTAGQMAGVYLSQVGSAYPELLRAGIWKGLKWDDGGMFVARGMQGVFAFTPEGESVTLPDETDIQISPNGNWVIAWGDGEKTAAGARLYQNPNGNLLQQLTDKLVTAVHWGPDSKTFFIQAEGALYQLSFPGLNPLVVETGFPADRGLDFSWME